MNVISLTCSFAALFLLCGVSFTQSNPQVQRVTVRHDVPDFLTERPANKEDEATSTTEGTTSTAAPVKITGKYISKPQYKEEDERFMKVKGTEPSTFWKDEAQMALKRKQHVKPIEKIAKNVIYFVGDGMSVPTITASRIYKSQLENYKFGEEGELHMETFPFVGTSKTFCSDAQVADSACSASALFCGSKTNIKTIGITPAVKLGDCPGQMKKENHLSSILQWAQEAGKSTGIVTTTRITHATPAGTYSHIAHRDWENDAEIAKSGFDPDKCDDIAEQLIFSEPGKNINVILGGGRKHFLPSSVADPETGMGARNDSKNLIELWQEDKADKKGKYVTTVDDLLNLDTSNTDYLLGLFSPDHIEYSDNLTLNQDPSLLNMTAVAIKILSKNPKGFFLMVEGGRIDHALHDNMGMRAFLETIELNKAIKHADEVTNDDDTLITVTSDHSHVMSIAGYPVRGNPMLGIAENSDVDHLPYTTISFANGPGFKNHTDGFRPNVSLEDISKVTYKQYSGIPLKYETHGGDDVLIFAKGPYAHFLTGVNFQNYIPHLMAYASCYGPEGNAQSPLCNVILTSTSGNVATASFKFFNILAILIPFYTWIISKSL